MHWLHAADVGVLRFINETLSNRVFDVMMPLASGNKLFIPVVLVAGILLLWKGRARGRLCVLMLALIVWPGDSYISNTIKHAVARPRPFVTLTGIRLPGTHPLRVSHPVETTSAAGKETKPVQKRGGYNSMPSSHAANWFAATMILLVFYRRSWRFMLPLACLVAFSRLYNGVHYPSDVLAGAILGAGYAAAGMWALNSLWLWAGPKWFPLWHEKLPSLLNPQAAALPVETGPREPAPASGSRQSLVDAQWLHLGYVLIGALLLFNLIYIGSGIIELSQDEAYQWIWSKHLALSYYSKPPLIAYTQFLGTRLFGDTEFGVRFFSPVISAILGILLLRFFAREVNARAGFFLLLAVAATPLLALGSVLMTIDPLSVLFWTAAMFAGWRAVQPEGKTMDWFWTGLWMGMGFLSKYTELFQILCWVVFFALWKPARAHLRRPGPWLALLLNVLCSLPVLFWNQQHDWITVTHVAGDASVGKPWHPTLRYFFDFLGKETALLNPVFFIAALWAAIAFWRRSRHDPRRVFLFSMGAPLFLSYLLYTFHSGVLPNWIAPSVLPLFCLMVIYWDTRWRLGLRSIKAWLVAGLSIGFAMVILMHDTDLVQSVAGRPLPTKPDPLTRVRAYSTMARMVGQVRTKFLAEGKPVFIIGDHYTTTSLLTFYLPEAKTNVVEHPLVYALTTRKPTSQFYFWPGYLDRKGQNALYVREMSVPPLVHGWFFKWLAGETNLSRYPPKAPPPPPMLVNEFLSVTNLGMFSARYRGRDYHYFQIFECRDLR